MAETVLRKQRLPKVGVTHPRGQETPNWLFTCEVCGKPITFDQPLAVWTQNHMVRVAHCRCEPARCNGTEEQHEADQ